VAVAALGNSPESGLQPKPADFTRVQKWFDQWKAEGHGGKLRLEQQVKFLERQEKFADLIPVYRELIARADVNDRERADLSSRLAYLLALQKQDTTKAVEMIDKAIEKVGPSPLLRQTRGLALLANGQNQTALDELQQSAEDSHSGLAYFHLALAYAAVNDLQAASRAIQLARDDHRFSPESLSPLERRPYQELIEKLGKEQNN